MAFLHVLKGYLLAGDPESFELLVEEGASLRPQDSKSSGPAFFSLGRVAHAGQLELGKSFTLEVGCTGF